MDIKKAEIHRIICEAVEELKRLRREYGKEFRDVPPVLWFGDIESSKPKVVVMSANPSNTEYMSAKNPHIPSAKGWKIDKPNIAELEEDYDRYFSNNPYTNWFGSNPAVRIARQGRIEDFLNGLDASFYGGLKYQAIHIDLIPFPTKNSFVKIVDELMGIKDTPHWIDKHVNDLISLISPKLIIINGRTNFQCFNQCVNLCAQPYTTFLHKGTGITIWQAKHQSNRAPIVGISANMGSRYTKDRQTLVDLGRFVKKSIKF